MNQLPPSTWWNRNWKWFVPVGCVTMLALFVGVVALLLAGVFGLMKQSDPYQQGLAAAQHNAAVVAALGSPIKAGFFATGTINVDGSSGEADLAIPISGPKGKGTVYVEGTKARGLWTYSAIEADIGHEQPRIDLLPDATGPRP